MPYDESLARRVRDALAHVTGVGEIRMMGGLCFTVNGNLCCGVDRDRLIVRVGPERYADALARPEAGPMDITGRPLRGFVLVTSEGTRTEAALRYWVRAGLAFAESLPAKEPEPARGTPGRSLHRD